MISISDRILFETNEIFDFFFQRSLKLFNHFFRKICFYSRIFNLQISFCQLFFVQNENFRFFIIFFHVKQIKTFEKSHNTETIKKIKKKIDILLSIVIEKSNTLFEIVLKADILSNESLSFSLKTFDKKNEIHCFIEFMM